MKQIQEAYIVAATRTPIGKSHKGAFRHMRPDDLLAHALRAALAQVPTLDPAAIEDVVCGCAIPEAQQGLNVARIGAVLAGLPNTVGGITVNRFCASGLSAIAMAAAALVGLTTPSIAQQGKLSGDSVKIGVLTDMSGVYADYGGPGAVAAAKMAVQDFGEIGRAHG